MTMRAPSSDLPIVLDDICVVAGNVTILDHVTVSMEPGAPTVLIGPNGSGKTTLLRTAMGLTAPTHGRLSYGGRPAARPTRAAIVLQQPTMLRRSVAANLRYALSAARIPHNSHERRVDELLDLVGLTGLGERPARRLSGGEQQRLALARGIAADPAVLFLDEPTANLDPAATKAIEDVVRAIAARGIKVVMSTHDLGEARRLAGDVVLLHRGRVIERGMANTFFDDPRTDDARQFLAGELLV
jgi:tungstate transport system ATP-binding protein